MSLFLIHVSIPDIKEVLAQFDDFDKDLDTKLSLDLKLISKKMNESKLQHVSSSVKLYKLLRSSALKTFNYYLTFVNTILIVLQYILLFYLICKYGIFAALLARAPVTTAMYITFPPTITEVPSFSTNISEPLTMKVMQIVAFIFLVYKSAIYVYKLLGFIYNLAKNPQQLLVHGLIPDNCKANLILEVCSPDNNVP